MTHTGVIIGRYQPMHHSQLRIVKHALDKVDRLIVVVGSHDQARTIKNPWTSAERIEMVQACLSPTELDRTRFVPLRDHLYNKNRWVADLQRGVCAASDVVDATCVTLFCSENDTNTNTSTRYGRLFPHWKIEHVRVPELERLSGSYIRMLYFIRDATWRELVPGPIMDRMLAFEATQTFRELDDEYHHIDDYWRAWEGAPFQPTFVTVNAVVVCSGHVLVIRRSGRLGKGLIALPGGFIRQRETVRDAAIRELKEATSIRVHRDDLDRCVVDQHVFDHPDRSLRGRTITHAFCVNMEAAELPRVKGKDGTGSVWWMPLCEVASRAASFFEDHAHIIEHMTSKF